MGDGPSDRVRPDDLAGRDAEVRSTSRVLDLPWARCRAACVARETILQCGLGPLMSLYTRVRVSGRARLKVLSSPVVFVANHSSHLDTPTILRALPLRWRRRTAVAAASDYFYNNRWVANGVALLCNTVPIVRGGGNRAGRFEHVDRLIDQRWNLIVFPEGTRSRSGELGRLHSGAAVLARQHRIPIVPIRITGTHDAMPPGRSWPKRVDGFLSRRHRVDIAFGPPISPLADEDCAALMRRVRSRLASEADGAEQIRDAPPETFGR
jgi:1-acyl-sn-glycerol-3-phosphate acyltransferase